MKKPALLLLVLLLAVSLSGCGMGTTEKDRQFMVAALGFEAAEEEIILSAEVIIINSESSESDPKPKLISAKGKTIEEALDNISSLLAKPLLLEHCGVIAIGDNMRADLLSGIFDYCFKENKITLSAHIISTKDPKILLSGEPESSVAIGYDIMGIIGQKSRLSGISYNSRFFEIEGRREQESKTFTLPRFERSEEGIALTGLAVFYDDKAVTNLNNNDAGLYSLITGNFESGRLRFGGEEYKLNFRRVEYGYSEEKSKKITLKLYISGDKLNKNSVKKLEKELISLENRLKKETNIDALGLTDILNRRFSEFDNDNGNFYTESKFTAKCILTGEA